MRPALDSVPMDAIQTLVRIIGDRTVAEDKKEALLAVSEAVSFASFIVPPIGQPLPGPVADTKGDHDRCDDDECCEVASPELTNLYRELANAVASHDAEAGIKAMTAMEGGRAISLLDWYRIIQQAIDLVWKFLKV